MSINPQINEELDVVRSYTSPHEGGQELAPAIVDALKPKGFFSLLLPDGLGGAQLDYPDYIKLVMQFAMIDASTAWCVNQGSVLASLARLIAPEDARKIWYRPGISIANGPPAGECFSQHGAEGYELTGCWNFSSGIAHADWLVGVASTNFQHGTRSPMMHLLPKSSAIIDKDWDVNGLRQTGSYQFSTKSLRIPDRLVFAYEIREDDPPLYQIPLNLLFAGGFAAVALGTSRTAIDRAIELCKTKIKRFTKDAMHLDNATQDKIGQAEATWQAANAFLENTVDQTWQAICQLGVCPKENKYQLRLAATHAIRQAKAATTLVYDLCSTDSIRRSEPIHRCFQDLHVIAQHLQGRPEIYALVGGHKLGQDIQSYLVD